MTDIHSHILPRIDDGARDIEESMALLRAELEGGVDTVVLTPHFHTNMTDLEGFLRKRERAHKMLMEEAAGLPMELLLGAEVRFSAELPMMDLERLCTGSKRHILIELPTSHFPHLAMDILYELTFIGVTPIIAHVERYPYLMRKPDIIDEFMDCGARLQINAESLLLGRRAVKPLLKLISEDQIHIIASDTHSMKTRPPMLAKAMEFVANKLGNNVATRLENNARSAIE